METFVIEYKEDGIKYSVIWKADFQGYAIESFWGSFVEFDRKKVSDVHIYKLDEIVCDTSNPYEDN